MTQHLDKAILVGNNSLFIIFGSNGTSNNNLYVLDIESWAWQSSLPAVVDDIGDGGGADPNHPDDPSQSSGSNAGTIAGAVVGSVAGVRFVSHYL